MLAETGRADCRQKMGCTVRRLAGFDSRSHQHLFAGSVCDQSSQPYPSSDSSESNRVPCTSFGRYSECRLPRRRVGTEARNNLRPISWKV